MNRQLTDDFKIPFALYETDKDGNIATEDGDTASGSTSDVAMATVAFDDTVEEKMYMNENEIVNWHWVEDQQGVRKFFLPLRLDKDTADAVRQ